MLSKASVMGMFFGILTLILFVLPKLSHADWSIGVGVGDRDREHHDWEEHGHHDWEEHHYGWQEHPYWGYHMNFLPPGGYTVWVGGVRYYYNDGLYYTYAGDGDYVVVDPPVGAYVNAIPPDFQPVIINGRTYYVNDGIYYVLTDHGYKVVPQPVVYAQPQVLVAPPQAVISQPAPVYGQDTFPVNIPNNSGGYTSVVIRRSGNGYVGPQGEYYATFPTVAQLRVMYGR